MQLKTGTQVAVIVKFMPRKTERPHWQLADHNIEVNFSAGIQ